MHAKATRHARLHTLATTRCEKCGSGHSIARLAYLIALCALFTEIPSPVFAAPGENRLSLSTYLGLHKPGLQDLSHKEFKAPVLADATIVDFDTDTSSSERLVFSNPLPELGAGSNAGLEAQWAFNDKYAFIVGAGTWEASSRATAEGLFAIQGVLSEVVNERSARISYNEFYFGLRRNVIISPKKIKVYYRATLNEIFDIDFREDFLFRYLSGPAEGVNKSIILQSQATGALALQAGFGMEYFFRDWLSIGIDANYLVGFSHVNLRDGRFNQDFLPTDNLSLFMPQRISPRTSNLEYLNPETQGEQDYREINLDFDGWKILFRAAIHY